MKVQVLQVRKTAKGLNIAHIQCGQLIGTALATDDVTGPGEYTLKSTLRVIKGEITPLVRVEK